MAANWNVNLQCGERIIISRSGHFSSTLKWIGLDPKKKRGKGEDKTEKERSR